MGGGVSRRGEGDRGEDKRCVGGAHRQPIWLKGMPRLPAEGRFADIRQYAVMVPMNQVKATPPRRRRSAKLSSDSSTSSPPTANSPSQLTPDTRKRIEHIDEWMLGSIELGGGRLTTEEEAAEAEEKKEAKEGEAEEQKEAKDGEAEEVDVVADAAEEAKAAGEGEEEKNVEDDKDKDEAAKVAASESEDEQLQAIADQFKKAKAASMATLKEEQDRSHHLQRSLANPSCHPPSVLAAPPRGAHRGSHRG